MPWASARTVRVALAVRSLHRVEINKHRIQRKAIGTLYRENQSAVSTGKSGRQCIQGEPIGTVYREEAIGSVYREKPSQGKDLNTRGLEST